MTYAVNPRILRDLRTADRKARRKEGGALWSSARKQRADRVSAQWLAGDKSIAMGRPFTLKIPKPGRNEAFLPDGRIRQVRVHHPLEIHEEVPAGARYLRLTIGVASRDVNLSTIRSAPVAATLISDSKTFGPATATFVFPVFAECFAQADPFYANVRNLYEWIVGENGNPGIPPFNRADAQQAVESAETINTMLGGPDRR